MIRSMTGFGSREAEVSPLGKVSIELRSSNHKFLEIVFHLPPGFLSLEDKIKKEIEAKIKRGRVLCNINVVSGKTSRVFINHNLLRQYAAALSSIKRQLHLRDNPSLDVLIGLPGVLSLAEGEVSTSVIWPRLKNLMQQAVRELVHTRRKEGRALYSYLKRRALDLKGDLAFIEARFKKSVKARLEALQTDEERSGVLREVDITEETERLRFHINNFTRKLAQQGPLGKELDFIAQEMQREANTAGAKSIDALISARAVQLKSQIEKIREQLQNIE